MWERIGEMRRGREEEKGLQTETLGYMDLCEMSHWWEIDDQLLSADGFFDPEIIIRSIGIGFFLIRDPRVLCIKNNKATHSKAEKCRSGKCRIRGNKAIGWPMAALNLSIITGVSCASAISEAEAVCKLLICETQKPSHMEQEDEGREFRWTTKAFVQQQLRKGVIDAKSAVV